MISLIKVYFRLAWFCKTPFVFLLDTRYKMIDKIQLLEIAAKVKGRYEANLSDCNDFAWRFKAEASHRKENGVGFVFGWAKWAHCPHCWNNALCPGGIHQVEPQTGEIFKKSGRYRTLAVII